MSLEANVTSSVHGSHMRDTVLIGYLCSI